MSLPSSQKAIKIFGPHDARLVEDAPIPSIRPDQVLVQVRAVGLNPADWKIIDWHAPVGTTVGCDYAGIVVEVGLTVGKKFVPGDRIAGFAHGGNDADPQDGTFAEYIVVAGDLQMKIPENMTFEEAATLGVGITTVGQALYQALKLPLPVPDSDAPPHETGKETKYILIHGGSTATGTLAIQLAKLSGLSVIATSSPHNFGLLRSYGADAVLSYKDRDFPSQARELNGRLYYAFDCTADAEAVKLCIDAIPRGIGGKLVTLDIFSSNPTDRTDIEYHWVLAYTAFGRPMVMGELGQLPGQKEDWEFAKMFWGLTESLFELGRLRAHPVKLGEGGLEGVLLGLDQLRKGEVSGAKLVYRI